MVESIRYKNFRVLRDTVLPLSAVTVIVGPNGSGKSTALESLRAIRNPDAYRRTDLLSLTAAAEDTVELAVHWLDQAVTQRKWEADAVIPPVAKRQILRQGEARKRGHGVDHFRVFSLLPSGIAAPVTLEKNIELDDNGGGLARVLTLLQDQWPERWDDLNKDLARWLPEFDRILLDTPSSGHRAFLLRTKLGQHHVPAHRLSDGTLLALALLTLAHLPVPPSLIGLEEPDRGIHPRLLRDVQDALYRLARPQDFGDDRPPVQVIATTHSPYFMDLFRDHPDEIVIAEKTGLEARFERLSDRADVDDILRDSHLGEAWYSGILGGVPARP